MQNRMTPKRYECGRRIPNQSSKDRAKTFQLTLSLEQYAPFLSDGLDAVRKGDALRRC